ncbi:dihydroorotate dehydrogenase [Fistulifera solaris]|uniref:Dihydroorotate dehydrogenase (quinone), mitochondrial n=1 Tax=Fistulifera solaris TaxID=1519565 RepID=A0A1Z5JU94_FISSO|nr:dihydroorotate dehydrogenase [Fistulifera solaris]|eukprot:GAX17590.1 dihydroorotate dehydrogenase [Fistulifera solaris]
MIRTAFWRTVVPAGVAVGILEVTTHLPSQGRAAPIYHTVADEWITPLMRRFLDPETAHEVALEFARRGWSPKHRPSALEQQLRVSSQVFGLQFTNPIGLAAGFDKHGTVVSPMLDLGFGFVEIGTVTPQPQPGNPKPRMFRLTEDRALINRYGFNSVGAEQVAENLAKSMQPSTMHQGIVGVNVGKNKTTEHAVEDYVQGIRILGPLADYLVINISSPNTPGLRDLQHKDALQPLLEACLAARDALSRHVPLLVKLAPDLSDDELSQLAQLCLQLQVDGLIVSNTTNVRPDDLLSYHRGELGGLSGAPLKDKSTHCIRQVYAATNGELPIIGVGGIESGKDVYEKLSAGASLVQVYSPLVYHGPGLVSRLRHELAEHMLQNGYRDISQVIGLDHEELQWKRRYERLKERQKMTRGDEEEDAVVVVEEEEQQ